MKNSKIPHSISFNETNLKQNIDNYNNKHNNNLSKWLNEGKIIQIDKNLFLETNHFKTIKEQLNQFYKIVNIDIVKLNPGLKDEILFFCGVKPKEISNLIIQYSKPFKTSIKFLNSFNLLCKTIIQQPVFVMEAVEKYNYPDSNTTIYYRHKYINDKINFSIDKFNKAGIDKIIHRILAKGLSNKPIQNLFIFTEQFINELIYCKPTGIDFIKSSLFYYFFTTVLSYKKKYISVFGNFEYENIEKLEKEFNNNLPDNQNNTLTGFKTTLTEPQITNLYNASQEYIGTEKQNLFNVLTGKECEPIIWKIDNKVKLRAFIIAIFQDPKEPQTISKKYFRDINNKVIRLNKKPAKTNMNYQSYIEDFQKYLK